MPHRGGTQTLFVFRDVFDENQGKVTGYEVAEATMRKPFEPLPEFASGWGDRCADGWAQTSAPRLRQK